MLLWTIVKDRRVNGRFRTNWLSGQWVWRESNIRRFLWSNICQIPWCTWAAHIEETSKKKWLTIAIGADKSVRQFVPPSTLRTIYNSFIQPYFGNSVQPCLGGSAWIRTSSKASKTTKPRSYDCNSSSYYSKLRTLAARARMERAL